MYTHQPRHRFYFVCSEFDPVSFRPALNLHGIDSTTILVHTDMKHHTHNANLSFHNIPKVTCRIEIWWVRWLFGYNEFEMMWALLHDVKKDQTVGRVWS